MAPPSTWRGRRVGRLRWQPEVARETAEHRFPFGIGRARYGGRGTAVAAATSRPEDGINWVAINRVTSGRADW
jgi:hypothetical protein